MRELEDDTANTVAKRRWPIVAVVVLVLSVGCVGWAMLVLNVQSTGDVPEAGSVGPVPEGNGVVILEE